MKCNTFLPAACTTSPMVTVTPPFLPLPVPISMSNNNYMLYITLILKDSDLFRWNGNEIQADRSLT